MHDDPILSPSSHVRFQQQQQEATVIDGSNGSAFMPGSWREGGVRSPSDHGGFEHIERSELASGFSMLGSTLPSMELMQRMRKSLSPEELQAAFARRYVCE